MPRWAGPHDVSEAGIWHAVRTAIPKIDTDQDLTMLSGPVPMESAAPGLRGENRPYRNGAAAAGEVTPAHGGQITIRLDRRTYSSMLGQASLPGTVTLPWWRNRTRYEYANQAGARSAR